MKIYIDQNQAARFAAPYFAGGRLIVAADALLNSKGGCGYDAKHTALLTRYGQATLVLTRAEWDRPGSWTISQTMTDPVAISVHRGMKTGDSVAFTYNGKRRQGIVIEAPWDSKAGSTVCRVECIGEEYPKTFTVDKMEDVSRPNRWSLQNAD